MTAPPLPPPAPASRPLLIRDARILTLARGARPRRRGELGHLSIIPRGDVLIADGVIAGVGAVNAPANTDVINARGRVLMPGFVDAHTHACWAGGSDHRVQEWTQKLSGTQYMDILAAGGGIMASVRAVRAASRAELKAELLERARRLLRHGTTTLEVKSGYGLSLDSELKMLDAIADAAGEFEGALVRTALLGHAIDADHPGGREEFIDHIIRRVLPAVTARHPGVAVDAFCERGSWTVDECERLFMSAEQNGHPVRVHADQFNSLGMIERAVRRLALSVDHLEASPSTDLALLGDRQTFGVLLPACGFHLDGRYANGRALIAAGGAVCIASNLNPGSAPVYSMATIIALAVRHCGLTPDEAIAAATVNPATLLGLHDRGTIAPGQRGDVILLRHTDERALAFCVGDNPVDAVIARGALIPPADRP